MTTQTTAITIQEPSARPGLFSSWFAFRLVITALVLLASLWAVAALHFDSPTAWSRAFLPLVYVAAIAMLWIRLPGQWLKLASTAGAFVLVLAWWLTLAPSNQRDWQPDLAALAFAEIDGDRVTVHNIRNCDYRSESDFQVRYYDKTYNLEDLTSVDLFLVYWGSPHMAHTMVSFGFNDRDYLCFSIETRKEKGEGYSAVRGLFRQFELIYVAADERDVVRLRTNYRRGEEAYLYRLRASPSQRRGLFLDYLRRLNELRERPEWYSAVTQNCSTSIRAQRTALDRAPWDWRMLANGHLDKLLYERGAIATNLPFADLKSKVHINSAAAAAADAGGFSRRIRDGVPGIN